MARYLNLNSLFYIVCGVSYMKDIYFNESFAYPFSSACASQCAGFAIGKLSKERKDNPVNFTSLKNAQSFVKIDENFYNNHTINVINMKSDSSGYRYKDGKSYTHVIIEVDGKPVAAIPYSNAFDLEDNYKAFCKYYKLCQTRDGYTVMRITNSEGDSEKKLIEGMPPLFFYDTATGFTKLGINGVNQMRSEETASISIEAITADRYINGEPNNKFSQWENEYCRCTGEYTPKGYERIVMYKDGQAIHHIVVKKSFITDGIRNQTTLEELSSIVNERTNEYSGTGYNFMSIKSGMQDLVNGKSVSDNVIDDIITYVRAYNDSLKYKASGSDDSGKKDVLEELRSLTNHFNTD